MIMKVAALFDRCVCVCVYVYVCEEVVQVGAGPDCTCNGGCFV